MRDFLELPLRMSSRDDLDYHKYGGKNHFNLWVWEPQLKYFGKLSTQACISYLFVPDCG